MNDKQPLTTAIAGRNIITFFKSYGHLCSSRYETNTASWSQQQILVENFGKEYAIATGSNKQIYLAGEKTNGNLCFLYWDGNQWSEEVTLKTDNSHFKNLSLTAAANKLHLMFLSLESDAELTYLYKDKNSWSDPLVISTKNTPQQLSNVIVPSDGNVHFMAQETDSAGASILRHYMLYRENNKFYSDIHDILIEKSPHNAQPYLTFDQKRLCLTYLDPGGGVLANFFDLQGWPERGWNKAQVVSGEDVKTSSPLLLTGSNRLTALWQQEAAIYYCPFIKGSGQWDKILKETDREKLLSILLNEHEVQFTYNVSASSPSLLLSLIEQEAEPFLSKLYPANEKTEEKGKEINESIASAKAPASVQPTFTNAQTNPEPVEKGNSQQKELLEKLEIHSDRIKNIQSELNHTIECLEKLKAQAKNLSENLSDKINGLMNSRVSSRDIQSLTEKVGHVAEEAKSAKLQYRQHEVSHAKAQAEEKIVMESMRKQIKVLQCEILKIKSQQKETGEQPPKKLPATKETNGLFKRLRTGVKR